MYFKLLLSLLPLLLIGSPAYAGWKRPLGIVMTSIGGVGVLAGSLMLASPDSCRPDNQAEACKKAKARQENQAATVLAASAGLVAGGIVFTIKGGNKTTSDFKSEQISIGLGTTRKKTPLLMVSSVW